MPNTEPLRLYLEGIDAYKAGDKEAALKLIAESVGVAEPTQIMREALPALARPNQAILALILHESEKEEE